MEVSVYGIESELETQSDSLEEVIAQIEAKEAVIKQIIADGEDITQARAEAVEKLKPITELEIVAQNAEEFLAASLEEAEDYLPRLIAGLEGVIEDFVTGSEGEGYQKLDQALEGFDWLNLIVRNLNNFPLQEAEVDIQALEATVAAWQEKLEELLTGLENKDTVLITDLLEYELIPILEDYQEFIKQINQVVQ